MARECVSVFLATALIAAITDGVLIMRVTDGLVTKCWNNQRGGEVRSRPVFEETPER